MAFFAAMRGKYIIYAIFTFDFNQTAQYPIIATTEAIYENFI